VRPRTFDQVCELIAAALGLFMPDECANYVRHCGYRFTTRKSKMLSKAFALQPPTSL
jgi:thermostable 8-oxoguanine DNA glycosylase